MSVWQWLITAVFVMGSLIVSYLDWNGIKGIKEFYANGFVKWQMILITVASVIIAYLCLPKLNIEGVTHGGVKESQ